MAKKDTTEENKVKLNIVLKDYVSSTEEEVEFQSETSDESEALQQAKETLESKYKKIVSCHVA
jgi:hypothetical protein